MHRYDLKRVLIIENQNGILVTRARTYLDEN